MSLKEVLLVTCVVYVVIYNPQKVSNIAQNTNIIDNKYLQNLGLTVYNDVAEETCDNVCLLLLLHLSYTLTMVTDIVSLMTSWTYSPWSEAPYEDAAERTALGGLSLDGFLSEVGGNQNVIGLIHVSQGPNSRPVSSSQFLFAHILMKCI